MNINEIFENARISKLAMGLGRSPNQINKIHESDAELIRLNDKTILAVSTDSITEEIELGFYREPYTMGWVLIMAAFSDIAAVGATPLGVTTCVQFTPDSGEQYLQDLFKGMHDACCELGTFILGGDMNSGSACVFSATAVGHLENRYVSRSGALPGDRVFITGKMGSGNLMAWKALQGTTDINNEAGYRPRARVNYAGLLLKYANAAIDTSDGLISALDQLMRINGVGFNIDSPAQDFIEMDEEMAQMKLNPFLLIAALHGEYEIVFSVSPEKVDSMLLDAASQGLNPVDIGEVRAESGLRFDTFGGILVDSVYLRNLFENSGGDLGKYMEGLFQYVSSHISGI